MKSEDDPFAIRALVVLIFFILMLPFYMVFSIVMMIKDIVIGRK